MSGLELFLVSVVIYAAIPFAILATGQLRYVLLFTHLSAVLVLGGFFNAVYRLPVVGDVDLGAGQVLYGALMFTTLVSVIVGRDLRAVRTVVALVITTNVLVSSSFFVARHALRDGQGFGSGLVEPALLDQSLRVVIGGGALIVVELLALLAFLEFAKARLRPVLMAPMYVVGYVGTLALDGVLFPIALIGPGILSVDLLTATVSAKIVLALAFSVPLALLVVVHRRTVALYEATPLHLRNLVMSGPAEVMRRLARQEEELHAATDREERATATVGQILDSATNTILIALDTDCRITHFNAGAEQLLGWSAAEVRGRTPEMLHQDDYWRQQAERLHVDPTPGRVVPALADEATNRELLMRTRSGAPLPVSVGTTRILGPEGRLIGYVTTGEEISARLELQQATLSALRRDQESLQRLREANAFKDSLISTVSHELRTPLSSITGYLELLQVGDLGRLTEPQQAAVESLDRGNRRLTQLVDSLLTLSRVETGRGDVPLGELDLAEVIDRLRPAIADLTRAADPRVEVTLAVPGRPVPVNGDFEAIETLVINLVSNALKFTVGAGSVVLSVSEADDGATDGATGPPSGPTLVVRDTGIGIPLDEQSSLFTTFFRSSEATRRAIPGTGLGLSIVAAIVQRHDAAISVDSRPGHGTAVTVRFPRLDRMAAGDTDTDTVADITPAR
ncbi:PAS domain-containing sensor histidine kinase [Nocardioides sp.]|uniref:sensor histidine kinase n=1 Tax=Nocardioides sp. TaxID=35761 RepID=UPI002B274BC5|nr:PAS domain-containing sensor histidine kinase [Nocardioides sp.]